MKGPVSQRVSGRPGSPARVAVVAAALLGALAGGCASDGEKDLRYRESSLLVPLEIPGGVEPPEHTGYLAIPETRGDAAQSGDGAAVDERPPNILGDGS